MARSEDSWVALRVEEINGWKENEESPNFKIVLLRKLQLQDTELPNVIHICTSYLL